jgi:FkbM family methyltransferase
MMAVRARRFDPAPRRRPRRLGGVRGPQSELAQDRRRYRWIGGPARECVAVRHSPLVAARELNGAGTVFSFECHPANHRFLRHNIRLNGLADRVVASSSAVANEIGRLRFRAPGGDLSTGSLLANHDHREAVDLRATTLDRALGGRPLDALKMDIEGGEVRALDGMERTLAASPALVLLVECNPSALRAAGFSAAELLDRLESAGFSVSQIDEKAETLRPVGEKLRAGEGEDDRKHHVNLYCARGVAA